MTDVDREVAENLAAIRERIAAAAHRAGRDLGKVVLVGASKRQSPERLRAAAAAGLAVFGENRVQEAEEHQAVLAGAPGSPTDWHLIGPLQSNKAKRAAEIFGTVHSVDRGKIARALDRHAGERGSILDCFLEVNLGGEESKAGFLPGELAERAAPLVRLRHLRVLGLMAIPPFPDDPEESRPWFRKLRELSEAMAERPEWRDRPKGQDGAGWPGKLSMGMSADYEVAIEEGATHVRVGTALFGARVRG